VKFTPSTPFQFYCYQLSSNCVPIYILTFRSCNHWFDSFNVKLSYYSQIVLDYFKLLHHSIVVTACMTACSSFWSSASAMFDHSRHSSSFYCVVSSWFVVPLLSFLVLTFPMFAVVDYLFYFLIPWWRHCRPCCGRPWSTWYFIDSSSPAWSLIVRLSRPSPAIRRASCICNHCELYISLPLAVVYIYFALPSSLRRRCTALVLQLNLPAKTPAFSFLLSLFGLLSPSIRCRPWTNWILISCISFRP